MPKEKVEELRAKNPDLYHVAFEKRTQPAFSGELYKAHARGMFNCAVCGAQLFSSDTKYDSGTGWPSFTDAIPGAVKEQQDTSHGMVRTEVVCANCGAHLGHVFDDGPGPSGCRYCINSVSLSLKPKAE
jgi:peptide-methionine (R)-S-oxide reductase